MIKISVNDFNLKDTITCGQIFRFKEVDDSYIVVLKDRVVKLKQDKDILYVTSNNEENLEAVIKDYLDLDRDYLSINKEILKRNPELKNSIDNCSGLKMIRQDKFETLISYIISANNRVSMISKVVDNISMRYGKKVIFEGKEYYLFPDSISMKDCTKEELRNLKTGFRDEYIYEIVNKINSKDFDLEKIDEMTSNEALDYLMSNKGIGLKVASCILLFAYSRFDVFPIDTWVKKYMLDNYNINTVSKIKKYSEEHYSNYSGLIIQYMFHSSRNK
ncbi:MAG: 8-oxoguanine DNA glycosylase [Clostridium sp.]|nr:8-oxoguanine DNA glycosylase [Clostridium sp.]MCM1444380.1 hypothetical protein [Candidatus Amulumruptor caecigallinarius]